MHVQSATDPAKWDAFLAKQQFPLFLQSWTMGEVYREIGQEPIRIEVREDDVITAVAQAIVVPARRGRHLMVQYGPLLTSPNQLQPILNALKDAARDNKCSFIRMSPFWLEKDPLITNLHEAGAKDSPLHLLSEYTWYIPLKESDRWSDSKLIAHGPKRSEEQILAEMRKTTRNLVGRAQREGVTVEASNEPLKDLEIYFELQKETFKRHHFVPYRDSYIRAQVKHFAPHKQAIVYIARYQGEAVAASVHMSYGGITSYHHGASTHKYAKIPASYLLQWTAIKEALGRGDDIYNFWGIAPRKTLENGDEVIIDKHHPFAGVTTFKTGFGGKPLPLMHCVDIPLTSGYYATRAFEFVRKWRRGF
jgi:lipid II:glycine glycyltransferase (peptidoglycan interpeptide bridge formation enzyme)